MKYSLIRILLLALYMLILPFGISIYADYEVLTVSVIILSLCFFVLNFIRAKECCSVTIVDAAVVLWVIYEWINIAVIRSYQLDELVYYKWATLGMVYLIARQARGADWFLFIFVIALSGGLQSIIGILQYFDIIESPIPDSAFKVTGSFRNPGPFGGYLSVSFVAVTCLFIQRKTLFWRMGSIILLLLIGSMLIYSDSRAAWLATLVSLLYFFYRFNQEYLLCSKHKRVLYSALLILGIAIVTGLYQYKKISADTRLLIWKNSCMMFADAPFCGHGIGSFAMKYMNYQAGYFEHHPDSKYVEISDNNTQSFNELITIFCEQGLVGGILILSIFVMSFMSKGPVGAKYILLSICVFSCFSYPGDILPLSILFPLLIGILSGRTLILLTFRKMMTVQFLILFFPLLTYISICSKKRYEIAFDQLQKKESQIVLLYNKEYMSRYLKILIEQKNFKEFIRLSMDEGFPFMTSVVKCDIGMSYLQLGETGQAEQALKSAYWMTPSKMLPRYFLFLFYRDTEHYGEARRMAEEILDLKISQKGSVYLSARAEARSFLNAESHHERQSY